MNIVAGDGSRMTVATATCHIRPGKGLTFSIDVLDDAASSEGNIDSVRAAIGAYMTEEITKAAELGVPIALPTVED